MLITSTSNSKVKELVKLKEKKYRDNNKLFFVEGIDLVMEAYKNKAISELYILDGEENPTEMEATYVSVDVMKKISDMESYTTCYAVCHKKEEAPIGKKILILDDIQDPGNLGTIIRSAVAFGFDTIVKSPGTVDLYNPKTIRSTKGMLYNINIITRELSSFIKSLEGYTIYGTSVINGSDIAREIIPGNIGIVIGNEGKGVSEEVKSLCDKFIYIKMNDKCESLNAGVAASILMYEVYKK